MRKKQEQKKENGKNTRIRKINSNNTEMKYSQLKLPKRKFPFNLLMCD